MRNFRIDTLWRYIFSEALSPALLGLGVYVLVFLMNALFELAELAIKKDLPVRTVMTILFYFLPRVLEMTIPMAILLGVLVGVGRMSTDSEVIALRAGGVSYWKILAPVLVLGISGWAICAYLMLGVEPRANYKRHRILNAMVYSADLRREIKPRVFFEEIPGMILYADEVHQGGDFLDKVFIYQSGEDGKEYVTVARRAQIEYDRRTGVARFYLESGTTHTTTPGEADNYQVSNFERQMIVKEPDESFRMRSSLITRPAPKNFREQSVAELRESSRRAEVISEEPIRERVVGQIMAVIHERFALPVACLVFALLGVPLGIMNRRGGKASGFALSIAIATVYWILLSAGQNLVSQGRLSPLIGLWLGNLLLALLGAMLFLLRERTEGIRLSLFVPMRLRRALDALRRRQEIQWEAAQRPTGSARMRRERRNAARGRLEAVSPGPITAEDDIQEESGRPASQRWRLIMMSGAALIAVLASLKYSPFLLVGLALLTILLIFSTTLDRYVLGRFGVILAGCIATFFSLFAVYEFIQLIDDLVEHSLPFSVALRYLEYRSPWILSQVLPMSCLVSTFLTFGIMSRFNEVIAVKAGGTSIYRLAAPVLIVTVAISTFAYVNQDYVMPYTNRRANQVKDAIRGRGARSYQAQERRWIFGSGGRLYNFQNYNPSPLPVLQSVGGTFQGFSSYRLEPETYEVNDRIYARTATWEDGRWTLSDGWEREFQGGRESFETFARKTFDFPEGSAYFINEWKSPEQMNYTELHTFVSDLRRRGYDVQELLVNLYDKTSFPLVSLTMVILGLPFCFRMGKRGSLYGIGIAIGLVGVFLLTFSTTNALGGIGLMPPFLSSWAPHILFAGAGGYLLLRTGT
ncbi:MAG TPA: LPS export ABC transporter permease LptF [Candidatus Polarisedimenticolia bacterium]|nr:LPS export ABC transporter permease LptF [Candidatus Polarisedimenticolia bacterium]